MPGVQAVLSQVNSKQAKVSPSLYIQRLFRGYRCRKVFHRLIRTIQKGSLAKSNSNDILQLASVMNLDDPNFAAKYKIPDESSKRPAHSGFLPFINPPTTPQTANTGQAYSTEPSFLSSGMPSSKIGNIFRRMVNTDLIRDSEQAMAAIQSKRNSEIAETFVKEVAGTADDVQAEKFLQGRREYTEESKALRQTVENDYYAEMVSYRVAQQEGTVDQATLEEFKQYEAQMVRQADFEYHANHIKEEARRIEELKEARDYKPVNLNVVNEKVKAEEHLTQQLACLAAVEKAYHERGVREKKFDRTATILASREVTQQALRKRSAIVLRDRAIHGEDGRKQRYLMHVIMEKMMDKDEEYAF